MNLNFQALYMWRIRFGISQLKKYQDSVEAFLVSEKNSLSKALQDIEESLETNEDHYYGLYSSVEEKYDEFAEHFPHTLRSSVIVQSYSFFEHHLETVCNHIYHEKKLVFQLKDLRGSDLEKAKMYLGKTCDVDISRYTPEWISITDLQKLRNLIVHSRGEFKDSNKDMKKVTEKYGSLSIWPEPEPDKPNTHSDDKIRTIFIADNKLNLEFLETIDSFFNKLTMDVFKA